MSLVLHYHPLASYCWKALIALYELDVPFEKNIVDLMDEKQRTAFYALWPIGKFPVIRDAERGLTVGEASIIVEHIDERNVLVPSDRDKARECRLRDRFFDNYVHTPMQKIVADKFRPEGAHDPHGVEEAKSRLRASYAIADEWMKTSKPWAIGDTFTMADCAACPALFYGRKLVPFGDGQRHLAEYYARLEERASFARVVEEAKPYFAMFPG